MKEHNNNSGYPELEVKHHPDFTWTICPTCHNSYEINYYGFVEVFDKWNSPR